MSARRAWGRVSAALALPLVFAACASTHASFVNATPGAPVAVRGDVYRPRGAGPFPAVVLLHGCEGVSANSGRWARWLREQGYLALVVDSWTPRGLAQTCSWSVPDPPPTERFDDAIGALAYLHGRPDVDRARIGVMGWSNGGVFALAVVNGPSLARATARGVTVPAPGFAAAVAVYPGGCASLVDERVLRPTLVLMGDADDWTEPASCVAMVDAMRRRGADIDIVLFPGAFHYFDFEGLPRRVLPDVGNDNKPGGCCGATVAGDAAALAAARRRAAEFLGYHLKAR